MLWIGARPTHALSAPAAAADDDGDDLVLLAAASSIRALIGTAAAPAALAVVRVVGGLLVGDGLGAAWRLRRTCLRSPSSGAPTSARAVCSTRSSGSR